MPKVSSSVEEIGSAAFSHHGLTEPAAEFRGCSAYGFGVGNHYSFAELDFANVCPASYGDFGVIRASDFGWFFREEGEGLGTLSMRGSRKNHPRRSCNIYEQPDVLFVPMVY